MNTETRKRLLRELSGMDDPYSETEQKESRDGGHAYLRHQPFDQSRSRDWQIGWLAQAEQVCAELDFDDDEDALAAAEQEGFFVVVNDKDGFWSQPPKAKNE